MEDFSRYAEFPSPLTVCDRDGIVLFMNEASKRQFAKSGGGDLIGRNLFDCHAPASNEKIRDMIAAGGSNAYFVEKAGKRTFVYQAPWYETGADGQRRAGGLVEISVELPKDIPTRVRG